jgi:flagellar biosynthetic protein FlhB
MAQYFFTASFHSPGATLNVTRLYRSSVGQVFPALGWMGVCLVFGTLAAQLGSTKFGLAVQKLAPDPKRLNPLTKLQNLIHQNLASFLQALIFLPLLAFAVYQIASENLVTYAGLARQAVLPAVATVTNTFLGFLWKAAALFCMIGVLDFLRVRRRHNQSLRMTKQEIRDEIKETEGNPQIRSRVRRIQRDLARRNMMKEIPKATAVIVNPTHYSVAIRYEMEIMAAPRVLAKGKNYLALRIRQRAIEHQVPIIENQPLAQALYNSADVGHEIPPHLYRAVAEVLAYIFRIMNPRGK